jgi:uncharacterized membrane protein YraQ (UPF0718 family)
VKRFYQIVENYVFLIIAIVAYIFLLFVKNDLFFQSIKSFWSLSVEVFPVILVVFLCIFLTNIFIDEKKIGRYFGEKSGWASWALAIVLGILSAGPIYVWYPLLADLRDKGMENSYIAVFLYNRAIKPQLLPMMIYYFGVLFVAVLTFYMIIASIINGIIVNKIVEEK